MNIKSLRIIYTILANIIYWTAYQFGYIDKWNAALESTFGFPVYLHWVVYLVLLCTALTLVNILHNKNNVLH